MANGRHALDVACRDDSAWGLLPTSGIGARSGRSHGAGGRGLREARSALHAPVLPGATGRNQVGLRGELAHDRNREGVRDGTVASGEGGDSHSRLPGYRRGLRERRGAVRSVCCALAWWSWISEGFMTVATLSLSPPASEAAGWRLAGEAPASGRGDHAARGGAGRTFGPFVALGFAWWSRDARGTSGAAGLTSPSAQVAAGVKRSPAGPSAASCIA